MLIIKLRGRKKWENIIKKKGTKFEKINTT